MSSKMQYEKLYARYFKRLFDIIIAFIGAIISIPIYIIVSLFIMFDSGRPVLYKQKRIGKNGNLFTIYKFRTMVKDADQLGPGHTVLGDNRITKSGKFLRKSSLDELPQLMNILIGNMSLVGYRPDIPRENTDLQRIKFKLKPGITGYAQINGRSSLTPEEVVFWEDKYVEDISVVTDFKILIGTVKAVLNKKDSF